MTLAKVYAPMLACDYRNGNGKRQCTNTFGGDQLGESHARLRRRAERAGWVNGSCAYWAKLYPGRKYDLCPECVALPDAIAGR